MTTTDFAKWLDANINNYDMDYNDIYSLYLGVEAGESYGPFDISTKETANGVMTFVKLGSADNSTLMLASQKAKETFLRNIEDKYCEGMGIEGWWSFHKEMGKD